MNDREYRLTMYKSLFEELESIEKNAMLQKEAFIPGAAVGFANRAVGAMNRLSGVGQSIKGFGSRALQGAKDIRSQGLRETGSKLRDAFETGAIRGEFGLGGKMQGPMGTFNARGNARDGFMGGLGGGIRGALGTDEGKALAIGGGALGTGALGAGAVANR